jgi:hypothetical protein
MIRVFPENKRAFRLEVSGHRQPGGYAPGINNTIEVTMERRVYSPEDFGWAADDQSRPVKDDRLAKDEILWSGRIQAKNVCSDYRLLVREYENLPGPADNEFSKHLVYADVIEFN